MLPLRVRLAQMMETASKDPGVIRRLIGLATVIVVIGGVVASGGFSLNLEFGREDDPDAPVSAGSGQTIAGGGDLAGDTSIAGGETLSPGSGAPGTGSASAAP